MRIPWWLTALIPFLIFCGTYVLLYQRFGKRISHAPTVLGLSLNEAVHTASKNNCGLQIVGKRHDTTAPEGTVLAQHPAPASKMRERQTIAVVVAAPQLPQETPTLLSLEPEKFNTLFPEWRIQWFYVPASISKTARCIGQTPSPEISNLEKRIIAYVASPLKDRVVVPDMRGQSYCFVHEKLKLYSSVTVSTIEVFENACKHNECNCTIVQQYPQAGSLIDLNKPCTFELLIEPHY